MQSHLKPITIKILVVTLLAVTASTGAPAVNADASTTAHVTRFDLVSHGLTVGHERIIRAPTLRNGKPCMESRLIIESKVDLLFYKYALNMDEVWIADESGLIAYKLDSIENGRHKIIIGELRNGEFRFEITEAGQKRVWSTPRASFDVAANSHPDPTTANDKATKVRVLDPATCVITERIYRGTGAETLTVGKQQIECNTITIDGPGTHLRRWFIADEFGPLILREDGREKRGTYSRRAVSMDRERKETE